MTVHPAASPGRSLGEGEQPQGGDEGVEAATGARRLLSEDVGGVRRRCRRRVLRPKNLEARAPEDPASVFSGASPDGAREAVYEVIHRRRDIRSFRSAPTPEAVLARVLDAAHHASLCASSRASTKASPFHDRYAPRNGDQRPFFSSRLGSERDRNTLWTDAVEHWSSRRGDGGSAACLVFRTRATGGRLNHTRATPPQGC